jgi:hypothetical protein
MKLTKFFALFLILLAALMSAQFVFAQGTDLGTITGIVTDPSGAIVPNAKVVILDLSTNAPRETKTNADGVYRVFGLSSGRYQVSVSLAGMRTTQVNNVQINGSDTVSANVQLKVASASETVDVTAEAPLVNMDDQVISDTINSRAVIELPRDSRDVYTFLYLNPNITQGATDGEFKFLGAQSYGANFSVDGQRSNGGIFSEHTSSQPSLEAVADINVLSNDFSAEYSGIANIRVTTKRGGAGYHGSAFYNNKNSALAAWTVQDLNAKADFAPTPILSKYPNPSFNYNDIGGSFGGPIPGLKKTWFFAAYERNYVVAPVTVQSSTLPHPSLWTGDFSLMDDSKKPAVPGAVTLTPEEIANDTVGGLGAQFITIPSRLLNPTVQSLINSYFPKIGLSAPIQSSTGRLPGYLSNLPTHSVQDVGTLRVDHDFSDKDRVYVTYNGSARTYTNTLVQSPYSGLGLHQNYRRNNTVQVSYTRVFNSSIVNEARGGFNKEKLYTHSNTTLGSFLSSVGFDQSDIDAYGAVVGPNELNTYGHPAVSFSNRYATFNNGGRNTDRPEDQNLATFGDTFTWVIRKHNLRMGADFVRNAAVDGFALNRGNPRGSITYLGAGANPFTKFLLGLGPDSAAYINVPRPPMDVHNWETGYFVQDDWKVTPRLTVNMGLRYELITPFVDARDLMANFDPNFVDTTTGQKGRFVVPSEKTIPYLDTRIVALGVVTASQSGLGVGRGVVRTDKNNFAPRIGAAFRLTDKSVIRGGYGFYFPTSAAQGIRDPLATNDFNQGLTKKNKDADGNPAPTLLQPWPGFAHGFSPLTGGVITSGFGGLPSINLVPFGLQQPRIQQYNATYEREIFRDTSLRFSYLGTSMSGLIAGVDLNEVKPSDNPLGTSTGGDGSIACDPVNNGDCQFSDADLARLPFPALGDYLLTYGNFGHGRSDAFQTQLEHRYSHGLMLNLSYTYLNQKSTGLDTGNSSLGGIAYNAFEPNHDYGQEAFVPKNRFVAYGVYDLPVGRGRQFGSSFSKWTDAFLGGWQTSFNLFAKSGTGFTPFWLCDNCGPALPGNIGVTSLDAYGDFNSEPSYRPIVTGNYNHRVGNQIWDPNAFDLPPFGADVFDNPKIAKRNLLYGPGTWGVNLGIHKDFHFGERVVATFGADIDNLFNHPLWSPDNDYGGGGGPFAFLGDFNIAVDPVTRKPVINMVDDGTGNLVRDISPNPDFGKLEQTFSQEGVDSRRTIRLRLRITF